MSLTGSWCGPTEGRRLQGGGGRPGLRQRGGLTAGHAGPGAEQDAAPPGRPSRSSWPKRESGESVQPDGWRAETGLQGGGSAGNQKLAPSPHTFRAELSVNRDRCGSVALYVLGEGWMRAGGNNEPWRICFSSISQRHLCGTPPHPQPWQTTQANHQSAKTVTYKCLWELRGWDHLEGGCGINLIGIMK